MSGSACQCVSVRVRELVRMSQPSATVSQWWEADFGPGQRHVCGPGACFLVPPPPKGTQKRSGGDCVAWGRCYLRERRAQPGAVEGAIQQHRVRRLLNLALRHALCESRLCRKRNGVAPPVNAVSERTAANTYTSALKFRTPRKLDALPPGGARVSGRVRKRPAGSAGYRPALYPIPNT